MPRRLRVLGIRTFAAIGMTFAVAGAPLPAASQTASDLNGQAVPLDGFSGSGVEAVLAAQRGDWTEADVLAYRTGDPVVGKLVFWIKATTAQSPVSFPDLTDFIAANPDWPSQTALRKRAEEAMVGDGYSADVVANWFERFPPLTSNGREQYAAALTALGPSERQQAAVREAWIKGSFSEDGEAAFLARYEPLLATDDHARRADRLLWDGNTQAAQRMLARLSGGERALADARIRLKRNQATPDQLAGHVPDSLRNHPGLVFDEVQWYRRNGYTSMARLRLTQVAGDTVQAERFWDERSILSRDALTDGDAASAYRIAAGHGLSGGADLAEAEWFAGWVAMRSLGDPDTAARHFERVAETSRMPISYARGSYWAARAREAAGRADEARAWYQRAAQFPTTFYGQLGGAAVAPGQPLPLQVDPIPTAEDLAAFERHELKRAADILAAAGRAGEFRTFVLKLADIMVTPGGRFLAAEYATRSGRTEISVAVAKQSVRDGLFLLESGYPMLTWVNDEAGAAIEAPLVLSVVRQESQFNTDAISPAGARGLMQLMPATAREVAGKLNLPYATETLTLDPAYNVRLGQAYLGRLLDTFSGSYVFALAGYNAGPGRVRQWLRDNGDPRGDLTTMIDWIELIPFSETRNYVQRTVEGLHVYRNRLIGPATPLLVHRDLVR